MSGLLAALLVAQAAADGFRAVQYTAAPVVLRGCSACRGEPDDLCEVRAGAHSLPLDQYADARWPAPGRLRLLRSKADPDCAVPAASLIGGRARVTLAAIRLAPGAPSAALLEQAGPALRGWPGAPPRREGAHPAQPAVRAALRAAIVCWPSEQGWPQPGTPLGPGNLCETWLLAVRPDGGEPDPAGASLPLGGQPYPFGSARFLAALEPASGAGAPALSGPAAATAKDTPAAAGAGPAVPPPALPPGRCGEEARGHPATLDRFDQWDLRIRSAARPSLDRGTLSLDAAAWIGHCPELEVLLAALARQLGCSPALQGRCGVGEEGR